MNLLIVPNVRGLAINNSNLALAGVQSGYTTCAHEIGHCFGLLHTFQESIVQETSYPGVPTESYTYYENVAREDAGATYPNPNDDPDYDDSYYEQPDMPCYNCEILGDGFCDTPADHETSIFCTENPNTRYDQCGEVIIDVGVDGCIDHTLKHNYMSYFNFDCRDCNFFSSEQKAHICATISTHHTSRIAGSQDPFTAIPITKGGNYECLPDGQKYVILEDITFTKDLNIYQCFGNQSVGIAPGVKLKFANGAKMYTYLSDLELYEGPFPECFEGQINGDKWAGIESGEVTLWQTNVSDAELPLDITDNGRMILNHCNIDGYTNGAVNARNSELFVIRDVEFNGQATNTSDAHVYLDNCSGLTLVASARMTSVSPGTKIGLHVINAPLKIHASTFTDFSQGVIVDFGSVVIDEGTVFSNCTETSAILTNVAFATVKNTYFNGGNSISNQFGSLTLDSPGMYSIEKCEFTDPEIEAIRLMNPSLDEANIIENNRFQAELVTSSIRVSSQSSQSGLRILCNEFLGSTGVNVGLLSQIHIRQGYGSFPDLSDAGNLFSNNLNISEGDIKGNSESSIFYYYYDEVNRQPERATTDKSIERFEKELCDIGPDIIITNDPDTPEDCPCSNGCYPPPCWTDRSPPTCSYLFQYFNGDQQAISDWWDAYIASQGMPGTPIPSTLTYCWIDKEPPVGDTPEGQGSEAINTFDRDNDLILDHIDDDDDNDGILDPYDEDWLPYELIASDPAMDPLLNHWEGMIGELENTEQVLIGQLDDIYDGGAPNFEDQLESLILSDPATAYAAMMATSPNLSLSSALVLIENSHYFTEQELVDIIVANPDLLQDVVIIELIYFNDNFSEASMQQFSQAGGTVTSKTQYENDLFEVRRNISNLIKKSYMRLLDYGKTYEEHILRSRNTSLTEQLLKEQYDRQLNFKKTLEEKLEFVVYPNPTRSEITITGPSTSESYYLKLIDITGKSVFSSSLSKKTKFDISQLIPGIYHCHILNEKNSVIWTNKITVIK